MISLRQTIQCLPQLILAWLVSRLSAYPHNPTGEDLTLRRRMVDDEGFGARIGEQEVSLFSTVVGLEGAMANG